MSSLERTAKRAKIRRGKNTLNKNQARTISKQLNNVRLSKQESKKSVGLFDLISVFELSMPQEQADVYIKNDKYVVTSLEEPNENDDIRIRNGTIYFPIFGLQVSCMINTTGDTTTIYILGSANGRYIAVNSFMKFFDAEEQLKITGYYIAREIAAYFNQLRSQEEKVAVPDVVMNSTIGSLDENEEES